MIETFAAAFAALYAAHHVGDYWVQTDHQAAHKGAAGPEGRRTCLAHVFSYVATQAVFLALLAPLGFRAGVLPAVLALTISGLTHYAADRREHGLMFRLALALPGKARFLRFGQGERSLASGAWALDQSWHIALGVFLPAVVLAL